MIDLAQIDPEQSSRAFSGLSGWTCGAKWQAGTMTSETIKVILMMTIMTGLMLGLRAPKLKALSRRARLWRQERH